MRGCTRAGRWANHVRSVLAASVVGVVFIVVAGCSAAPAATTLQLERTLVERDRMAIVAHDANTARLASYLRDKWGPVPLPAPDIRRWVAASEWAPTVARCLSDAGHPGVRSADNGERLDFSGVRVVEPRALFEIDVATFDCQAQYPVRAWFEASVRDVEAPWAHTYTLEVLVPCLLAAGHEVPPVPDAEKFRLTWRTDDQFDPYVLVGGTAPNRARAVSLCPSADAVLDSAP